MAFGGSCNDLPMLERVGYPYLMENAAPELKSHVSTRCRTAAEVLTAL